MDKDNCGKYTQGLVSVIIPTYKRADKFLRAINSVCNQTYENIEILVINDNENDDQYTKELLVLFEKITDPRVKLIFQERHINGAAARNAGIKKAKGEFIAFLDDDDIWAENKVQRQIETFSELDESFGAVSTLFCSFLENTIISKSIPYKDGYIWENILLRRCDVTTCSIMLRHEALDETGYFDESLKRHQEIQLLSFFSKKYKIYLLKEYLLYVDAWGENNPNSDRIIKIKEDFFKAVNPLMKDLPEKRQKRIINMHKFEIAFVFLREKKLFQCMKYFIPVVSSPFTLYYAIERVVIRRKSKRLAKNESSRILNCKD